MLMTAIEFIWNVVLRYVFWYTVLVLVTVGTFMWFWAMVEYIAP